MIIIPFFMPEIPLPLQQSKDELCAGINEGMIFTILAR